MTHRYAAFLRAVNVGGHTIKMDELRRTFERAGLEAVETIIASGNVVFESSRRSEPALEALIERTLQKTFGYPVPTFLRSIPELAEIAARTPFRTAPLGSGSMFVGFLRSRPLAKAIAKIEALSADTDELRVDGREIHWLARKGFSGSAVSGALLEKTIQMAATFRNVNTLRRIADKYCGR